MSEFDPGYEYVSFLIEALRENAYIQHLLFDGTLPKVNENDTRVYESDVDLAPYGLAAVLPRILVSVELDVFTWEQSGGQNAPCNVRVHHFATRDRSVLVQKLAKATDDVLTSLEGSTGPTSARIMSAPLSRVGPQIKDRQPAFDEARRITNQYTTRLVGVLV